MMFELCYTQHGGSGLGLTRACVEDMELCDIVRWIKRLSTTREDESKALRKAQAAARGVRLIT